jgi:hypothetical protein
VLEKSGEAPGTANFELAVVAEHRHDANQAAHHFRLCLTNTPTATPLWQQPVTVCWRWKQRQRIDRRSRTGWPTQKTVVKFLPPILSNKKPILAAAKMG